jgi:hypothetical protein
MPVPPCILYPCRINASTWLLLGIPLRSSYTSGSLSSISILGFRARYTSLLVAPGTEWLEVAGTGSP